jgi:hypothetical protein
VRGSVVAGERNTAIAAEAELEQTRPPRLLSIRPFMTAPKVSIEYVDAAIPSGQNALVILGEYAKR